MNQTLYLALIGSAAAGICGPSGDTTCNTNSAVCINDQVSSNNCYNSAGNYCDAGIRDVCIKDNDCTTEVNKYTNAAKYTNICKNNAKVGPNVTKKVNDVYHNLGVNSNKNYCNNNQIAKPVKAPYSGYGGYGGGCGYGGGYGGYGSGCG